ncbi:MAG: SDR family oxidoreductase [Planctomycetota bacterium]|jgi:uncharacterized protein YbjT (DUF2867 family)
MSQESRSQHEHADRPTVFLTGATGYIGGRLAGRLLAEGYRVRCLARDPGKLASRPWTSDPHVQIVVGDLAEPSRLAGLMTGCTAAYYLVHSMMTAGRDYAARDRELARSFAQAARNGGVERIVYLGGLGETGEDLSEHLASRREVERELASTGVPVTVLRAAMIIGSGSASFEILRYLVERLPIMITPRWVRTPSQPIAVDNVLRYLVDCLEVTETAGRTLDIGGPEVLTYEDIMQLMAAALKLPRRLIIPVPVLTPRLSSLWIHIITPISHRIARPLADGLRNRVVCRNDNAAVLMPQRLLSVREAIDAAVLEHDAGEVETSWSDAGPMPGDPDWAGGKVFVDRRERPVGAPASAVFAAVCRVGGGHGYYAADWLWRLRGLMDRMVGGPGLRRGRRHPEHVAYGDALDFWRVTGIEDGQRLDLHAEMKLPGDAQLGFEVRPEPGDGSRCRLVQTARFKPRGLVGLVYWYAVLPLHGIVFNGMLRGIERAAIEIRDGAAPGGAAPDGGATPC